MKILSVIESLELGGAESVLVDLVLGLREHQHRVVHFASSNGLTPYRPFVEALRDNDVDCIDVPWMTCRNEVAWERVLAGFSPDVVFFHWWGHDPLRDWVCRSNIKPIGDRPSFVCVLHRAELAAPPNYDRYVLVANHQLRQIARVSSKHIRVIPNGVALDRFEAAKCRRASEGGFVVGRLSCLFANKIPRDWVRTLLSFQIPRTSFVIAGDGESLPTLIEDARQLKAADRFSFPGCVARSDVPALLETFDVFCYVTSIAVECHPLVILEALASGLPVVAEDRGGISEIVSHGVNGLLASSTSEIGTHLRNLRHDVRLRQDLADGARMTALEFSLDRQLDSYRVLLNEIGDERGAVARAGAQTG
jgi:glycosyltransferase involved in cell wall biosynthesis